MSYECLIVADSVAPNNCRLITFEVTYPLIIHAELLTHRVFSRNVASNRAIPVKKLIASVEDNPFIPEKFPKNQAGMQSAQWLEGTLAEASRMTWLRARDHAVESAQALMDLDVHKQIANRLLAPFLWTTAVITATDWNNFFSLRVDTELAKSCNTWEEYTRINDASPSPFPAQREIQKIAFFMYKEHGVSTPKPLKQGEWHLPYITEETVKVLYPNLTEEQLLDKLIKVSIGRCARVSYLNHGSDTDPAKDVELCERLIAARHMSPTEHVATPMTESAYYGNLRGWLQYRKYAIKGESGENA